jgi:hypothetical protein
VALCDDQRPLGTPPDAVVTSNAGCLLQIRRYLDPSVPLFHSVQLVDASTRGVDPVHAARRPVPRYRVTVQSRERAPRV